MKLAVSTHWNAHRHQDGRQLLEELAEAGFHRAELGYDLTVDLVEGITQLVEEKAFSIVSVHNYCPVPMGAPMGHPELFDLSSKDRGMRTSAVKHTTRTIEFAAQVKASAVVVHCGYAKMRNLTVKLLDMARNGKLYSDKFEKLKTKLIMKRGKAAEKALDRLRRSIEELLPVAEANGIKICPENLPLWEAVPSEAEMMELIEEFKSPWLGYWHDIGHGQIRQELGFSTQTTWMKRLKPTGYHVHDMNERFDDHLMPPRGKIDFSAFKDVIDNDSLFVLEPAPGTPVQYLITAAEHLKQSWNMDMEG